MITLDSIRAYSRKHSEKTAYKVNILGAKATLNGAPDKRTIDGLQTLCTEQPEAVKLSFPKDELHMNVTGQEVNFLPGHHLAAIVGQAAGADETETTETPRKGKRKNRNADELANVNGETASV